MTNKNKQYIDLCISASSIFSTCGKKQYAAVLVDKHDHIVGMGYNGGPRGFTHCNDGGCPRLEQMSINGSSYDNCIAVHAEANALLHSNYSSEPKKIYVNGPPCFSCAKLIANSTIEEVYYVADKCYNNWEEIKTFLNKAKVSTFEMEI
jgi:deoxycytidylate deaminase